jgi:hypothetical protein
MVAPIDAKATFDVEGEAITLRLNFRALALADKEGIDVLAGKALPPLRLAVLMRCLAAQEHPDMTDEEAFAIVVRGGADAGKAIASLFSDFGGSAEGNVKKKPAKA